MYKVSVVCLIYNTCQYLERCVKSLMEQTLDSIQYVFVNDCSQDNSMDILSNVLNNYPNRKDDVIILNNPENLGTAKSRIKGIDACQGKYVIHCDSDDWIDVHMMQTLYENASQKDLDVVCCDIVSTNGVSENVLSQKSSLNPVDAIKGILRGKKLGSLWNHLVKREIVHDKGIQSPKSQVMEDAVLLIQYLLNSKAIGYVDRPLYFYYRHKSTSESNEKEKNLWIIREMDVNLSIIFNLLENCPYSKELRHYIQYRKYFNKRWLLPFINNFHDCSLWLKEYPDINLALYFNPLLTKYDKLTSFLVEMRVYPYIRKVLRGR